MLNLSPLTNFKKLDSNFCINWNLAHILIFNPYKINNNFGTTGHRRKIQKAKLVRIKFPIELSNFYLSKTFFCIEVFLPHQVLVKLKKATAKLNPSGFGSAQLSLFWALNSCYSVCDHRNLMLEALYDKTCLAKNRII